MPAGRRRIYRVITAGLGVRVSPDVNAQRTGDILRRGDLFEASVVAPGVDGRTYLKLAGARGWVFDDSAVDLEDPSVELVAEEELLAMRSPRSTTPGGRQWGPHSVDPSAHMQIAAFAEAPPLPRAGGYGTPSQFSTPAANIRQQPPPLQLMQAADMGGYPNSPRSSGFAPPSHFRGAPPGHASMNFSGAEFRAVSPMGGISPRQRQHFIQNGSHAPSAGIMGPQVGLSPVHTQHGATPRRGGDAVPEISDSFREAMGGGSYPTARRRQMA